MEDFVMSESVENVPVMVEKPKNRSSGALA